MDKHKGWVRVRKCNNADEPHYFETLETFTAAATVSSVSIARSADKSKVTFDRDRLLSDFSLTIGPVLDKAERNSLLAGVEARLATLVPARRNRKAFSLTLDQVRDAVIDELLARGKDRSRTLDSGIAYRKAHVLYALARGPFATAADQGFEAIDDILAWLAAQHAELQRQAPLEWDFRPHYRTPRFDNWHPMRNDAAPVPRSLLRHRLVRDRVAYRSRIVERHHYDDRQTQSSHPGEVQNIYHPEQYEVVGDERDEYVVEAFDFNRFYRSVWSAFAGRSPQQPKEQADDPDAPSLPALPPDFAHHQTTYIVQWVLWALAGQPVVRASDVVALTTQCLRRVDAVAYARWAIVQKNLTVTGLWEELQGMLAFPPIRLRFPSTAAADPRYSENLQPDLWKMFDVAGTD